MVTHSILATVEKGRLQKAVEGLVSGAYAITLASQTEAEIRGFVANGDGKQYGVVLTEGHAFCSCPDAMYRKSVCKHAVVLALHVIRTPKAETVEEERPVTLKLGRVRPGWQACA
jgi:predicted nucleic acid-binding Zn finger protein